MCKTVQRGALQFSSPNEGDGTKQQVRVCDKHEEEHSSMGIIMTIYRVSQEEWTILRESVPYVKIYRYNPEHLCPKLNFTEIKAREKCGLFAAPRTVPGSHDVIPIRCALSVLVYS